MNGGSGLPAPIADRLGKLIPRLASDHNGEVLATVAAIGRTLAGAGCDWHDLAALVERQDDPVDFSWPTPRPAPQTEPTPQRTAAEWADIIRKQMQDEEAKRAKSSPWPTFKKLTHFGRCELLNRIAGMAWCSLMNKPDRDAFDALRAKIIQRPQEIVTRKEANLFNRLSSALWGMDQDRNKEAS